MIKGKRMLKAIFTDLRCANSLIEKSLADEGLAPNNLWIAEGDLMDALIKIRKVMKASKFKEGSYTGKK